MLRAKKLQNPWKNTGIFRCDIVVLVNWSMNNETL